MQYTTNWGTGAIGPWLGSRLSKLAMAPSTAAELSGSLNEWGWAIRVERQVRELKRRADNSFLSAQEIFVPLCSNSLISGSGYL